MVSHILRMSTSVGDFCGCPFIKCTLPCMSKEMHQQGFTESCDSLVESLIEKKFLHDILLFCR